MPGVLLHHRQRMKEVPGVHLMLLWVFPTTSDWKLVSFNISGLYCMHDATL